VVTSYGQHNEGSDGHPTVPWIFGQIGSFLSRNLSSSLRDNDPDDDKKCSSGQMTVSDSFAGHHLLLKYLIGAFHCSVVLFLKVEDSKQTCRL